MTRHDVITFLRQFACLMIFDHEWVVTDVVTIDYKVADLGLAPGDVLIYRECARCGLTYTVGLKAPDPIDATDGG